MATRARAAGDDGGMNRIALLVSVLVLSCGSDGGGAVDARGAADAEIVDPTVLRVGGEYPTQVMLLDSSCASTNVMSLPTAVAHQPGATTVSLIHAGSTYPGTIETDGDFMTSPVPQQVGADTHTLTMAGTFTTTGFTATVSVAVTRGGAAVCSYLVSWVGTRQSGLNVIPG